MVVSPNMMEQGMVTQMIVNQSKKDSLCREDEA
jgi:hypothetical protein